MTRVLLIEDEAELRALLVEELEELGYAVTAAEHGAAGLAALESLTPDVILTDIGMPVMTGLEFVAAYLARADDRPAPVIALSAFTTAEDIARARAAGVVDYLRKPIDFDALERAVTAHAPSAPT